ncbi:MAG: DUF805 domain-containing protein [Flavobacteriia bacterium]|nr:DUF805 domain-containing protein [Flavobacteriia bacterium]
MNYFLQAFKKWNDFNGKSDLKSFWIFFLIFSLLPIPIKFLEIIFNFEELYSIVLLIMIVPYLAYGFRRLNDAGFNKFLFLIPFVGLIIALFPSKNEESF